MQNIKVVIIIIILFLSSFLSSFLTLDNMGLTWDELVYLKAAKHHSAWLCNIPKQDIKTHFSKKTIKKYWHYNEEHPQFSKILMGISYSGFHKFLGEINSVRILSTLLYSLTIILLFLFIYKFYSMEVATFSSIFLLFLPRYFGHAHIISIDVQMGFFTLLSIYTFILGIENKKWGLIYGIIQGCAISTKVSLVFLPFLLFSWGYVFHREKIRYNFYSFLFLSPIIYFLTNPYLWYGFYDNLYKFINNTLTREAFNRVPLYYLGKQYLWEYPYEDPICYPWHYPYIMMLVTIPAIILINFFVGIIRVAKDKIGILLLLNFIIPLLIFTPTNVPKYDGERLFLQSYIFLCAIASIGFIYILNLANRISVGFKKIVAVGTFLILFLPFYNVKPFYLEYYNEFIGGVKGAHKQGFETTYWGNVVDEKFLNFLNKRVPPHSRVLFSPFAQEILEFYQKEGKLRKDIIVQAVTLPKPWVFIEYDYLVLISRQGLFTKEMWTFYQKMSPVHTVSLNNVPLVVLYQLN